VPRSNRHRPPLALLHVKCLVSRALQPLGTHANMSLDFMSSPDECIVCAAGTSCPPESTAPTPCMPGSVASARGSSVCVACAPGTFQSQSGATACVLCERGSYCPRGAPSPLGCESGAGIANAQTIVEAASSSADCDCSPGYYNAAPPEASEVTCTLCPSGSNCRGAAGLTEATLPAAHAGEVVKEGISLGLAVALMVVCLAIGFCSELADGRSSLRPGRV
jgi:hypothetical protein